MMDDAEVAEQSAQWCVYAYLGPDSAILYVGSTKNLVKRHRTHVGHTWWGRRATRLVVIMLADQANCLRLERRVIRRARPLFNIKHTSGRMTAARQYLERVPPADPRSCYELRRTVDMIPVDELLRLAA